MRKPQFLLTIFLLLIAGCGTPTVPTPAAAVESPEENPGNPYLHCLSEPMRMNQPRATHSATLLPDGRVLIAGGFRSEGSREIAIASAEIYDPATRKFTPTMDMHEARDGHIAVLLPNGEVLLAGGWALNSRSSSAELFNHNTGTFRPTGSMMSPRDGMTATLLENGKVLIAGGGSAQNTLLADSEIYDPSTGEFALAGILNEPRRAHTATLLQDGRVILIGGNSTDSVLAGGEIYDATIEEFYPAGQINVARHKHSAVLLPDGNVLILGGSNWHDWTGQYTSAEIFDPAIHQSTLTTSLNAERFKIMDATLLLPDGNVLVAGGSHLIEVFDTRAETFVPGGTLDTSYYYPVATLLNDGSVLITGGYDSNIRPSNQAWLFCPTK